MMTPFQHITTHGLELRVTPETISEPVSLCCNWWLRTIFKGKKSDFRVMETGIESREQDDGGGGGQHWAPPKHLLQAGEVLLTVHLNTNTGVQIELL